jgi:hypothetical protein
VRRRNLVRGGRALKRRFDDAHDAFKVELDAFKHAMRARKNMRFNIRRKNSAAIRFCGFRV